MIYDWIDFTYGDELNIKKKTALQCFHSYRYDASQEGGVIDLYQMRFIDINKISFTIEFVYKAVSINYADWACLFAFGTHYRYSSDVHWYTLAFRPDSYNDSERRGVTLYGNGKDESFVKDFHKYIVTYDIDNHIIAYYVDNVFLGQYNRSVFTDYFYLNGSGCNQTSTGVLKYLKIYEGIDVFNKNKMYSNNDNMYGILKEED